MPSEVLWLKLLEEENGRLKKLVADLLFEGHAAGCCNKTCMVRPVIARLVRTIWGTTVA
jgi:hypothetical protein